MSVLKSRADLPQRTRRDRPVRIIALYHRVLCVLCGKSSLDKRLSLNGKENRGWRRRGLRHRNHPSIAGFLALVPRCRPAGGARRLFARQRVHGDPPLRICDLGADPAGAGSPHQGDRPRERVFSAVHPREPAPQGSRARRRVRAAGRLRHARRRRGARREARRAADLRSHHRHDAPNGCNRGATCQSSSTSGRTWCAGKR